MNGGILVFAEQLRGSVVEITYEMLGLARSVATALNVPLYAALVGKDVASLAGHLGSADTVLVVEDPQLEMPPARTTAGVLKALAEQKQIALVFLGGTNVSLGVGSLLSVQAGVPFVNFCRGARVDQGAIVLTSQLFGGKILSDVRLAANRGVVCVSPGVFPPDAGKSPRTPAVERVDVAVEPPTVIFKGYVEPAAADVDITKQDILVSVGRGIQSQENIALAEELAGVLGGAVSSSRPVVDQGWLPLTRQVGKSGMQVKPKLYLALGISGAPEHQEGMKNAPLIVAVNTDPKAPIFDIAHYGTTLDLFDLVPALQEAVQKRKAGA
jgi:electron transfer flavoprotein alpha subunit